MKDKLITQLVAELSEARKDAVRQADVAMGTVDRIVASRFDRMERPAPVRPAQQHPLFQENLNLEDDEDFLKGVSGTAQ